MLNWYVQCSNPLIYDTWSSFFLNKCASTQVLFKFICTIIYMLIVVFINKNVLLIPFFLFIPGVSFTIIRHGVTNLGLMNTLSFWHPLNLLCIWALIYGIYNNFKFTKPTIILLCLNFLILGSWWSSQELLWQGWWNWDGVENTILLLLAYTYILTHTKQNNFNSTFGIVELSVFIFLYFFVLNKTGIFKSIHSFTNSTYNLYSYWIFLYTVICYIAYVRFNLTRPIMFYYNTLVWTLFYSYIYIIGGNIFIKQPFFFYVDIILLLFLFFFRSVIFLPTALIIFFTTPVQFALAFLIFLIISTFLFKKRKLLHSVVSLFTFNLILFLTSQVTFYTLQETLSYSTLFGFSYINNILFSNQQNTSVYSIYNKVENMYIFKNILVCAPQINCISTTTCSLLKHYMLYNVFYIVVFFFYIVTEVSYSKQNPRFKYYNRMYVFKPDLLVNQQKFRRIPNKITGAHWGSKSMNMSKQNLFLTTDFLSIDLRLYKFLLRKVKKKLLRLKIKTYVGLFPNNKISHKSKNSRMGKGKGLNNRFYFRLKKTKPILIFKGFNKIRFLKFKKYLCKFFSYKYF